MKNILVLLSLIIGSSVTLATPVLFNLRQLTNAPATDRFTLVADGRYNPHTDGTNLIGGFPLMIRASNGVAVVNLSPVGYTLTMPGWARSLHFNVYATNATVNVITLITNGLPTYNPWNGGSGGGSTSGFSGTVTNTSIMDTGVVAYQVAGGAFYPGYQNGTYRRIAARVFKEDGVASVLFYGVDGWAIGNTTNCYIGSLQCVPDYYCPTNAATPEGLVFIPYNSDAPAPSVTAIPGTIITNVNLTVFSNGLCVTNILQ